VLVMPGLREPIARVATDSRFAIVLPLTFMETDVRPNLADGIRSVTVSHGTSHGFLHGRTRSRSMPPSWLKRDIALGWNTIS
jgi:hypothetical protein